MNKKVFGRKLSRSRPTREALFASLIGSLIKNGKIETTRAKAKAVVPGAEKIITLAKKGDLASRRKILSKLDNSKEAFGILFTNVVTAFSEKNSGFTRTISLPRRVGDNTEMVRLEWTEKVEYKSNKKEEGFVKKGKDKKGRKTKEGKSIKKEIEAKK